MFSPRSIILMAWRRMHQFHCWTALKAAWKCRVLLQRCPFQNLPPHWSITRVKWNWAWMVSTRNANTQVHHKERFPQTGGAHKSVPAKIAAILVLYLCVGLHPECPVQRLRMISTMRIKRKTWHIQDSTKRCIRTILRKTVKLPLGREMK